MEASEQYGLHGLMAGGATTTSRGNIYGYWKLNAVKDGYLEDSLDARLSVSSIANDPVKLAYCLSLYSNV